MMEKDYTDHVTSLYCVVMMNNSINISKEFLWVLGGGWGFWNACKGLCSLILRS